MGAGKKNDSKKRLSHGRPPAFQQPKALSSKATKILINKHHVLEKKKVQAVLRKDQYTFDAVESEIQALGGIEAYQQASLQGQRNDRGGDSSRVLMEWLKSIAVTLKERPLRMLEVGALSVTNACSRSGCFLMERIDLNSQAPGILQQDFMKRPLPKTESERFDAISLSLVLNFVPDPRQRGTMLWRTIAFLRDPTKAEPAFHGFFPSLFLVLPAPCIANSRYIDDQRLNQIMESLGFKLVRSKVTSKLVYYLWWRMPSMLKADPSLERKLELRSGSTRNNFAILLDSSWPGWATTSL